VLDNFLTFREPVDTDDDNTNDEDLEQGLLGDEVPVTAGGSIDWRQKNAVTPVKNQGSCGGCYTFSTTGSMEGAYAIKTGKLYDFSEQQLLDCSGNGNAGCSGGYMTNSFKYLQGAKLMQDSDYPYTGRAGTC